MNWDKDIKTILAENGFYSDYFEINNKLIVIGKKGRFVEPYYTIYEIRINNGITTYESILKEAHYSRLSDAKNLVNYILPTLTK